MSNSSHTMTTASTVAQPVQTAQQEAQQLESLASMAMEEAKAQGASSSAVGVSKSQGMSVTVRMGDVETVEHNRDKGLVVTVYFGHKTGSASTADFKPEAVRDTVRAACTIAKYTAEDDANGLADADRLERSPKDMGLYHPWAPNMDDAIDLALQTEQIARDGDPRITNADGTSVSSHEGVEVMANSHGFIASTCATQHSVGCSVIASNDNGMQRGSWYSVARDASQLEDHATIGATAARRACERLDGRKLQTMKTPVIYEATVASSLLRHFVSAISGGALYRKASFLLDSLDKQVFSDFVRIHEQPHLLGALGSSSYDSEGVSTATRDLITNGVLQGYVLSSYSARKLNTATTGNAGGVRNLSIDHSGQSLEQMLKTMDKGLFVTDLIGFGVNNVTGDYSRGASGFWVEGGEIQYPVEEITVAGNLTDMFKSIVAVGDDTDLRGNVRTGSIMLEELTVAGA